MESDSEEDSNFEDDFYSFLNVSRNATNEDLTAAYRRLSRLYHPDKHVDPLRKKEAEILFNKTKKAYEVLIDPHRRAIYDSVGTRGLQTEGWEIVQRTKTPQEIREEYERLARERDERRLQQRTNPKGNVTVNINATNIFNRYEEDYDDYSEPSGFGAIEVSGMSFTQSVEAPITTRDTATLSGQLSTHNGTGSGQFAISSRRLLSESAWVEGEFAVGNGPTFSLKGFRTLTKRVFFNTAVTLQATPVGVRPGHVSSLAMQLDKHIMGYLTWRAGHQSAMSTAIIYDTTAAHAAVTFQMGIPHSYLALSLSYKMPARELKLKTVIKAGTFGGTFEYGVEKRLSPHSTISAAVAVGVPTGVMLKVKLTRASQTYLFPIHLAEEIVPSAVFYATVAPLVSWALVKRFIIDPLAKDRQEKESKKQKEQNKAKINEKRREANAAIELMMATYARCRDYEMTRNGLVVEFAWYGAEEIINTLRETPSMTLDSTDTSVWNVLVPLQCLVKDSKLSLHSGSKNQLPGFLDPCPCEPKLLLVRYLFRGNPHVIQIADTETLSLPKTQHRIHTTT